jgi:hypothetical protein
MAKSSTTKKSSAKKKTSKTAAAKTSSRSSTATAKKKTTTKKTATAKKTAAVKKPAATKKATAAASSKKTTMVKKKSDGWQSLRGLYALQLIVTLALGGLTIFMMSVVQRSLTIGYSAQDALIGGDAIAPAVRQFALVDIRWIIVGFLALIGGYTALVVTKGWNRYVQNVRSGRNTARWIMFVVGSIAALYVGGLINGIQDVATLKLLGLAIMCVGIFGIFSERLIGKKEKQYSFYAATLATLGVVAMLGFIIANTYVFGFVVQPWYILLSIGGFAITQLLFIVNLSRDLKLKKEMSDPLAVDRNYVVITLLMQLLVVTPLIIGFAK